jgi:hypothetical protein
LFCPDRPRRLSLPRRSQAFNSRTREQLELPTLYGLCVRIASVQRFWKGVRQTGCVRWRRPSETLEALSRLVEYGAADLESQVRGASKSLFACLYQTVQ